MGSLIFNRHQTELETQAEVGGGGSNFVKKKLRSIFFYISA